jgi:hypothetical protein
MVENLGTAATFLLMAARHTIASVEQFRHFISWDAYFLMTASMSCIIPMSLAITARKAW